MVRARVDTPPSQVAVHCVHAAQADMVQLREHTVSEAAPHAVVWNEGSAQLVHVAHWVSAVGEQAREAYIPAPQLLQARHEACCALG